MFADMVLSNGKVVTIDANGSIDEAVAIKFGRILAVGSNEQIKLLIDSGTKVVDLKGGTIIPGLNDSHCHISMSGGLRQVMGVIDVSYEQGVDTHHIRKDKQVPHWEKHHQHMPSLSCEVSPVPPGAYS